MDKDALKQRKEEKKRKPRFVQQDSHKKDRLKKKWKRPRGLQSKMRLNKRGYRKPVKMGYRAPKSVRGLHPSGLETIRVSTTKDLETLDAKSQGAEISSTVGQRKRLDIIKAAQEKGITILNIKDPAAYLKKAEESQAKKKEAKKKREAKKKAEKSKKDSKKESKKEESEGGSDEPKDKEKKEQDKILTTKK